MKRPLHLADDIISALGEGYVIDLGRKMEILTAGVVLHPREEHDGAVDKFVASCTNIPEKKDN